MEEMKRLMKLTALFVVAAMLTELPLMAAEEKTLHVVFSTECNGYFDWQTGTSRDVMT